MRVMHSEAREGKEALTHLRGQRKKPGESTSGGKTEGTEKESYA